METIDLIKGLRAYRHRMQKAMRDGTCNDDEKRQYLFRFSFKPAGYSNFGGQFKLKAFLSQQSSGHLCSNCGMPESNRYVEPVKTDLANGQLCHSCGLWESRRNALKSDSVAIVDGNMFSIRRAVRPDADGSSLGHSGAAFVFTPIGDGDNVVSNDVWHGGTLPTWLRVDFPDTHTSSHMDRKEYADWYYRDPDSRNKLADVLTRMLKMTRDEALFHLAYNCWNPQRVMRVYHAYKPGHKFALKEYKPHD